MADTPTITQDTGIKQFNLMDSVKNAVAAQTKNSITQATTKLNIAVAAKTATTKLNNAVAAQTKNTATPAKIRLNVPTKIVTPATKYEKTNKVLINNTVGPLKDTATLHTGVVGGSNGTYKLDYASNTSNKVAPAPADKRISIITPVSKAPVIGDKIIKLDPREANGTLVTKIPFGISEEEWVKAQNTKVSIDPVGKTGTLVPAGKATVTGPSKAPMAPWVKDRYIKEGKPMVDGSIHNESTTIPIADPTGRTGPTEYLNKPPVVGKPTIAIPTGNTSNTLTRNVSSILQGTNKIGSVIGNTSSLLANTKPSQPTLNIQTARPYNTALLANTKPVEGETRRRNVMMSSSSSGKKITL